MIMMASSFNVSNLFLQFLFLSFSLSFLLYHSFGLQHPLCDHSDRSSLLQFKQSFVFDKFYCDPSTGYTKLTSWNASDDCCSWDGVECDDQTGHVIGLDLSSRCLFGSINSSSSLFRLLHLTSLNLSYNNFNLSRIPSAIRSLSKLKHLYLSSTNFSDQIPPEMLELSGLVSLDLRNNSYLMLQNPSLKDVAETLTNLTKLQLSGVNISSRVPQSLSNLTSLMTLHLKNCSLYGEFPPAIFRLPNLRVLSLRSNPDLTGYLPEFQVSSPLEEIWLEGSIFSGQLPVSFGNLKSLSFFDARGCRFRGLIPYSIGNLTKLKVLDLTENYFSGNIPSSLANLLQLKYLSLSHNNFWSNDFHSLSVTLRLTNLQFLDLSFNELEGPLPVPPPSITFYKLSQNKFSGNVSSLFCNLTSLLGLDLSDNNLSGNMPPCLANLGTSALILSLRNNNLSGKIPDNFASGCALKLMDFSRNKIEGEVPRSLANCSNLEILNLEGNEMNDVFPSWLGNLPRLRILSLRSNKLHGAIGQPLSRLEFNRLQIIDPSDNNFTGKLPMDYFANWVAMKSVDYGHLAYMETSPTSEVAGFPMDFRYPYFISIVNKGTERAYEKILEFFVVVDLSRNKFEGEIPDIIDTLRALQSLNLSNNILTGHIPSSLGNLKDLEALDLSRNELSGEIPVQLSVLTSLSIFSVFHNNLIGPIPQGNQFGTFENDSFSANPGLCGIPLSKKCGDTGSSSLPPSEDKDEDEESPIELNWQNVLMGFGSGIVIGVAYGYAMDTRKYEWLVSRKFARWRRSRRN